MEDFKVIPNQPKFIPKSQRGKIEPDSEENNVRVRSRSPRFKPQKMENSSIPQITKQPEKRRNLLSTEWDPSEDTIDLNDELYTKKLPPKPLTGKTSAPKANYSDSHTISIETKPFAHMSDRDWKIYRENHLLFIKGKALPPIRNWGELNCNSTILRAISRLRYKVPTPIQMQGIPIGLAGKDLIALAPTGSGKTTAYLVPLLDYILNTNISIETCGIEGPLGLVIAPTRELALQIYAETIKLCHYTQLSPFCMVGGHDIEKQFHELSKGHEIVIATPGRLLDCIERQYIVLNQCFWLVIDEADKLILLDQQDTLKGILSKIPGEHWKSDIETEVSIQEKLIENRQGHFITTSLFSATMDPEIEAIWRGLLKHPTLISIGDPSSGSENIEQKLIFTSNSAKKGLLKSLLKTLKKPVIVFVNQRVTADNLAEILFNFSYKVACLHGGRAQETREKIMDRFRRGKIDVLFATDLASRGIDVKHLPTVVNYDAPKSITDYEHRIGRTGRMAAKGFSITFFTPEDEDLAPDLKSYLERNKQNIPKELLNHPRLLHADDKIVL